MLAILDRSTADHALVVKAARLARLFGAHLELFLCDAEHAYALKHAYEPRHIEEVRRRCLEEAIQYLTGLREATGLQVSNTSVSAACESPLYEGIVRKVKESRSALVVKNASGVHSPAEAAFDPNDWQLMRTCPVTLLMSRGRAWHAHPRFAAAVDVSADKTAGLARGVLETSAMLSDAHGSQTDVLYSEPGPEDTLPTALQEGHYDVLTLGALTHLLGIPTWVGSLTSRLVDAADCDFVLAKP